MKNCRPRTTLRRAAAIAGGVALVTTAVLNPAAPVVADEGTSKPSSKKLRAAVTPEAVWAHLEAFDAIGSANGDTRSSGTPGYAASVDYVVDELEAAGYDPQVQEFDFPFFEQLGPATFAQVSPTPRTHAEGVDFALMTYSGSGDVSEPVRAIDLNLGDLAGSTSGCQESDFPETEDPYIALIRRGGCTFGQKVANADAKGAAAVVIMNTGTPGNTGAFAGTLGTPARIPAVGTSFELGQSLAGQVQQGEVVARLAADTLSEIRQTWNVLAETQHGRPDNVVMAGAHLDSVTAGPGVNDNGSGSAALLETAIQIAKTPVTNKVRFAWWGAEEFNLIGSTHYVNNLFEAELQKIALYLNFDMVGSPNYALMVYDGDNSAYPVGPGAAKGPEGSGAIEQMFHDFYASQSLPSAETPFSGRSDYGPFIAEGIPAGGLFTGAEGVKTAEQAALFGGTAGQAYDPCYHQACDTIANVSEEAIDYNSDAIAHAVLTYGMSTASVNGDTRGHELPGGTVAGVPSGDGSDSGGGLHDGHEHPVTE